MSAFFLAFLSCLGMTFAGREQVLVARLSGRLGQGRGLLVLVWLSSIGTSALAAWLAKSMTPLLVPTARQLFVGFALGLAGLDLLLGRQRRLPVEPTRSLGAIGLVLFTGQLTDSARFLILALSVLTGAPFWVASGGIIGSGAALTVAWMAGEFWEKRLPLRVFQYVAGGLFLLASVMVLLFAKGLVD
ncbi:hypothetical protein D6851_07150 [Altericroceibacterium spongiae]|uniref:GDT1 family protein n=1 Tax=Altericroceibacterium spongiae TaxID=2320269 RepID=A0A420EMB6_9SPHN|nr:TMEM165/GDT1 family protein [Altericroceibacterium spongiae]RKF21790.1 hypothetical protein D6851_07150 [Altericroceibacterium spongiae]